MGVNDFEGSDGGLLPARSQWRDASKIATETSMIGLSEEFVRDFLRDECKRVGGQAKWAEMHGVSAAYVNDVLHGRRDPGDGICAPLGLRRHVTYLYDHDRATAAEAKRKQQEK